MKLIHLLYLLPLVLAGCVGYNSAVFMTKSNAGLDFDMKPPTVEINISRKEGVVEPSFEGGKTPPVMASFSSKSGAGDGLGRFFFGVDQTFSGGDAAVTMARLYDTNGLPEESVAFDSGVTLSKTPDYSNRSKKGAIKRFLFGLQEAGEVRPFFFGTDSQLGVKVGWNGVGGAYPDNVKIGYNRKELAVAPVSYNPREVGSNGVVRTNVVRVPSFLATVDSDVEASSGVSVSWMQYFATGDAATLLARQPGVRRAMAARTDPSSAEKSKEAEQERIFQAGAINARASALVKDIDNMDDTDAMALAANPPLPAPQIDQYIDAVDSLNARGTDADVARKTLKMRAAMTIRGSLDNLTTWEKAVNPPQ